MTLKKTLVLAAAALMTATGMANATATAVANGDWHNPSTWDHTPGTGENVVINGFTVTLTTASSLNPSVGDVQISNGGILDVQGSRTLMMASGSIADSTSQFIIRDVGMAVLDSGQFTVTDGVVDVKAGAVFRMQGTTPELDINKADGMVLRGENSRLEVVTSATISGGGTNGSLIGLDPAAAIVINFEGDSNVVLTLQSDAIVHGQLTFQAEPNDGTGDLDNNGKIEADAGDGTRILLDASLDDITDSGNCPANWWASNSSELRFERTAASLGSSFNVAAGSDFVISGFGVTVATTGRKHGAGNFPSSPSPFSHSGTTPCP